MKNAFIASSLAILIVAILAALVLPATQRAREAAGPAAAMVEEGLALSRGEPASTALYATAPAAKNAPADANSALPGGGAVTSSDIHRKIIYQADVDLVVEDFSGLPEKVAELVKRFDGYLADSSLTGASGDSRRSTWKIRVPVARFEEFVGSAKTLGELRSASTTSQDV